MKILVALLLCLYTLTAHAQTWPRNPKTNKVEFTGVLPWPATAKTEAQRRALVRRWYLAKLTTSSPEVVAADVATNKTNGLLTYAELPKVAVLREGSGETAQYLAYIVTIAPTTKGVNVVFSDFETGRGSADNTPLETHLVAPAENEQAALAELRKRLAGAVKGWN